MNQNNNLKEMKEGCGPTHECQAVAFGEPTAPSYTQEQLKIRKWGNEWNRKQREKEK